MINKDLKEYMHKFIEDICDEIGPRKSASGQEKNAGDKIEAIFKEFCDETVQEEFTLHPKAFLGFIRYGALMAIVSIVLYWLSLLIDRGQLQIDQIFSLIFLTTALILITFSAIYFVSEVMRQREFVDILFPKKKSYNVIGSLRPKSEIKHTVIFSAHHDSAYEFNLFYYLKAFGGIAVFLGFFAVFLAFINVILKFIFFFLPIEITAYFFWAGVVLLCFLPIATLFLFFLSSNAVLGAWDNLSGVAILLGIGKFLSENRGNESIYPKHTKIGLISFGCEEAGLRGSKRYVKKHCDELEKNKTIIINIDSVGPKDKIVLINNEVLLGIKHDKELINRLSIIANELKIKFKLSSLPIGGSDAAHFTKKGLPATTVMALNLKENPPRFYHTRYDTPKVVEKEALGQVLQICLEYIKYWDGIN